MDSAFARYLVDRKSEDAGTAAAMLAQNGIITFHASGRADFLELMSQLGEVVMHRDSATDGVTVVSYDPEMAGRSGYAGMSCGPLSPHTDSSGLARPPDAVGLYCEQSSGDGGEAFLLDGYQLLDRLTTTAPYVAEALSREGCAVFHSGGSTYRGAVFERSADGPPRIRLRLDDLGYFATDVLALLPVLERHLTNLGFTVELRPGEGYLIDNRRFLHGRRPFTGKRRMLRVLLNLPSPTSSHGEPAVCGGSRAGRE